MIGWAPLDEPEPIKSPPLGKPSFKKNSMNIAETECNYLVLFFIVGVLGLALKDMMNK
jgi:hypothetical protein